MFMRWLPGATPLLHHVQKSIVAALEQATVSLTRVTCCRMGSFTSAPKIANDDAQDSEVVFPARLSRDELLQRCHSEQRHAAVKRAFRRVSNAFPDR